MAQDGSPRYTNAPGRALSGRSFRALFQGARFQGARFQGARFQGGVGPTDPSSGCAELGPSSRNPCSWLHASGPDWCRHRIGARWFLRLADRSVAPSVALACKGPLNTRLATGVGLSFFLSGGPFCCAPRGLLWSLHLCRIPLGGAFGQQPSFADGAVGRSARLAGCARCVAGRLVCVPWWLLPSRA